MVVFAQVVEQGTLSSAAKHLGLSRAVVSYHLKKLEEQIGIKLLNRSTRTASLTHAGQDYYQHCRMIAAHASSANQQIENLKKEPVGLLKITCPVSAGLQAIVPALNEFKLLYPKIELDIMLTDEVVNIMKEGIDLAIRAAPLLDSSLQAVKLISLSTCICGSPSYFNQHNKPESPDELTEHQWVMYKLSSKPFKMTKGKRDFTVEMSGSISTNNASARTALVMGGHGLGRIPLYDAKPKLQSGELVSILDDYKMKDIDVYGVFPPGNASSKKLRLLIDHLKSYLIQQSLKL